MNKGGIMRNAISGIKNAKSNQEEDPKKRGCGPQISSNIVANDIIEENVFFQSGNIRKGVQKNDSSKIKDP